MLCILCLGVVGHAMAHVWKSENKVQFTTHAMWAPEMKRQAWEEHLNQMSHWVIAAPGCYHLFTTVQGCGAA
jgi:hypothetical protein